MNKNILFVLILMVGLATSCGEYQKALKSEDIKLKYDLAEQYFDKGDYKRSARLFEDVVPTYVGKPQGERVLYMYAQSLYQLERYSLAEYQFGRFAKLYPTSQKASEASFLQAKSLYLEVPRYSVDQTLTYKALEALQSFIDRYPNAEYTREANDMVLELLVQLQRKSFEIAKQYDTIRDYQAAMKSLDNFLSENPGTIFKEEALYTKLHSAYELAINSREAVKKARLESAKEVYQSLVKSFPETQYLKKADKMLEEINKNLEQYQ